MLRQFCIPFAVLVNETYMMFHLLSTNNQLIGGIALIYISSVKTKVIEWIQLNRIIITVEIKNPELVID